MKYWVIILLCAAINSRCNAWGAVGHKITAQIAYSKLNQSTKDSLVKYLGETSIQEASVWMDEVRSDHSFDYMKPWHYINIEKDAKYDPASTDNIIWALNKVISELKDRQKLSKEQTTQDLKILIHLMGDLSQPLHVGYGIDKGGNSVKLLFLGKESNLHKAWDSEIIKEEHMTAETILQNMGSAREYNEHVEKIDLIAWMNASRSFIPIVYSFKDDAISDAYIKKATVVIGHQLALSGFRMAFVLEEIFK